MATPDDNLTPTQLEILHAVWQLGPAPATVAAIWEQVQRDLARTTVLTQVQRLEKKGWLLRTDALNAAAYRAAMPKDQAERRLAKRFVSDFFAGSTAGLVKSLLGSGRIARAELEALKAVIARAEGEKAS